jgi:hypothetical protein
MHTGPRMFVTASPYRERNAALWTPLIAILITLLPFTSLAARSVVLAWDPSDGTNVIAGYRIYRGGASGTYTNTIDVGNVTTATVSGLTEGATYYFAATAYDTSALESDFSNEISYRVPTSGNTAPTLNPLNNLTLNEGASSQTVSLSGIGSGATNESQTLTVTASSSNTGLIPAPAVTYTSPNATGSITFTPVAYAYGTATISVTVNDGGVSNNIVVRSFTVVVNPVNQAPTLNTIAGRTINEGAGAQSVSLSGIGSGATNESQTLTVTASSSNTGLIPTPAVTYTSPNATGSIAFTPVAYAYGSANITVTVSDGGASNNVISRSFTVLVNPVNQAPTLNALANLTINESASSQSVSLSGIGSGATNESQTLTVTASSSNTGLIPAPTVTYTSPNANGTLAFAPLPYANGSATITVTVSDGGASNNVVSRAFTVTVAPVNQPPTLNALADRTINKNAGLQTVSLSGIGTGQSNEVQTLVVTASSSDTDLIPAPSVAYTSPNATGSISFTPLANAYGAAVITVTVNDGGATSNLISRTFTVHVNQPPVISALTDRVIAVGTATPAIAFDIIDAETPMASLTVSASSSNPSVVPNTGIVLAGTGGTRTVTVTPLAAQSGVATITLTVSDGLASASSAFQLRVQPRPAAPGSFRVTQLLP